MLSNLGLFCREMPCDLIVFSPKRGHLGASAMLRVGETSEKPDSQSSWHIPWKQATTECARGPDGRHADDSAAPVGYRKRAEARVRCDC
jgi:hypothetical protein